MGVPYRRTAWAQSVAPFASACEAASAWFSSRELYKAIFPAAAWSLNDASRLAFSSLPFEPYQRPNRDGRHFARPKTDGATLRVLWMALSAFVIVSAFSAWLLDS
ncbi:MAG TPA: hypothetical protein VGJ01_18345 [Pseudolabrys sp.]|jgi:hypothetical protein